MNQDPVIFIVVTFIAVAIGLALLYFIIKSAIKNALIEDRAFQSKVENMKQQASSRAPRGEPRA